LATAGHATLPRHLLLAPLPLLPIRSSQLCRQDRTLVPIRLAILPETEFILPHRVQKLLGAGAAGAAIWSEQRQLIQ
jgi:hypothetical protein